MGNKHLLPGMLTPFFHDIIADEVNVKKVNYCYKKIEFEKDGKRYVASICFSNDDFAPNKLICDGYDVLCDDDFFRQRVKESIGGAEVIKQERGSDE
jgi:hypothetical protein